MYIERLFHPILQGYVGYYSAGDERYYSAVNVECCLAGYAGTIWLISNRSIGIELPSMPYVGADDRCCFVNRQRVHQ